MLFLRGGVEQPPAWDRVKLDKKQVCQTQIQTKIKWDKHQEGQTLIGTYMNRRGAIMKLDKH